MGKQNVFVVGYDEFNVANLRRLPASENVEFHPALYYEELHQDEETPAIEALNTGIKRIDESGITPDGVITFWDFPATIISAMLAARYTCPGPPIRSLFRCENKAWSRSEQRKAIVDNIPRFRAFDPNDTEAYEKINLLPPFWIKPVKSFQSFLAYKVEDRGSFEQYRQEMADKVPLLYKPFCDLMRKCRVPDLVATSPDSCIAESLLSGHMCTVEGYVYDSEVIAYGIVDSIREPGYSSFNRYQYPSNLPMDVQYRMMEITRKIVSYFDLNDTCFNVEFFFNQTEDQIYLLEINPRTSQSHAELFERIHGYSQFEVLVTLGLGNRPKAMMRHGEFNIAAKYMHRVFQPGIVKRVPTEKEIKALEEEFPGTAFQILVEEGNKLEELPFQDSYSYVLANIHTGAESELALAEKYDRICKKLPLEIEFYPNE